MKDSAYRESCATETLRQGCGALLARLFQISPRVGRLKIQEWGSILLNGRVYKPKTFKSSKIKQQVESIIAIYCNYRNLMKSLPFFNMFLNILNIQILQVFSNQQHFSNQLSNQLSWAALRWRSLPTSSPPPCLAATRHPFDAAKHLPGGPAWPVARRLERFRNSNFYSNFCQFNGHFQQLSTPIWQHRNTFALIDWNVISLRLL